MKLIGVTYTNNIIDDESVFRLLPKQFQDFLKQVNGIIAYKGGLHIRGCCKEPNWHSIEHVLSGKNAFWKNYPEILDIDIPFAEDAMGDQFLFRNEKVIKLFTETGEIEELNIDFNGFLEEVTKDPVSFLGMHPLIQFESEGGKLNPGELLNAYPPFCLAGSSEGVSLKALSSEERLFFLSNLYKTMSRGDDEDKINFIVG